MGMLRSFQDSNPTVDSKKEGTMLGVGVEGQEVVRQTTDIRAGGKSLPEEGRTGAMA